MADVDAVNERLNGLVTLLQAVGVGGVDKNEMDRVSQSLSKGDLGLPDARQLNDEQVEALIRKLQQAQAEAPQIIAALEAHAEARSLNGGQGRAAAQQQMQQQQQQQQHEEEDDDDDEYDEDGNYPMVGHGCSDDISVVSDLTTPTVLTGVPVPEEEHYRETLPPMMVGGGHGEAPPMMIQPPRRKNLVNQVARGGPGVVPPPRRIAPQTAQPSRSTAGGAAAARRKNYQSTMAKLHENPHGMGYVGPSGAPAQQHHSPPPKKVHGSSSSIGSSEKPRQGSVSGEGRTPKGGPKSRTGAPSTGGPKKRVVKKTPPPEKDPSNFSELASSRAAAPKNNSAGWNAFDAPAPRSPKKPQTSIDDDGFLVGDGFDPFGAAPIDTAAANPFRSPAGDLAFNALTDPFMASAGFDAAFPADGKKKARPKKPERMPSAQSTRSKGVGAGSTAGGVNHPGAPAQRPRPRSGRRASTSN